jgi:hypothetical protein
VDVDESPTFAGEEVRGCVVSPRTNRLRRVGDWRRGVAVAPQALWRRAETTGFVFNYAVSRLAQGMKEPRLSRGSVLRLPQADLA